MVAAEKATPFSERVANMLASGLFAVDNAASALLRGDDEQRALRRARKLMPILIAPFFVARRENYKNIFPGTTAADLQTLKAKHFDYLARVKVDTSRLSVETPEIVRRKVQISGEEHLRDAHAQGRGVLIIAGHVGTWWHIPLALASRGYPITAMINPRLGALTRYMGELAARYGLELAEVGHSAYAAARASFAANRIVFLTMDVSVRRADSRWMPFGGAEFLVDVGPAVMALRHRVPVVWTQAYHDAEGRSNIRFTPAMEFARSTHGAEDVMRCWLKRLYADVNAQRHQWWALNFISSRKRTNQSAS